MPTLIPRPALFLFGYVASSLFLLEHAIWSYTSGEAEQATDVEVFRRWVMEGGLTSAVEDVRRVRKFTAERVEMDVGIVFGLSGTGMAKL
jgi:hypothetical protein